VTLASSSAVKTVLPVTLISRTNTRKVGSGFVSGGIGAGGKSIPGGGMGGSNFSGSVGGSPERPVGSTGKGTPTVAAWALAAKKIKKIKNSGSTALDASLPSFSLFRF
jgi:hypothetical protein